MPLPATRSEDRTRPILAIDTSSEQGGVALYDGHRLSTRSWPAGRSHTTTLLSEIHQLLQSARVEVADLAAIAVAIGPGAFTGLRVGFGTAKGFHLATGVPLLGVSTLEATALPFSSCGQRVAATVAAGRGRLVWAHYASDRAQIIEVQPPRNGTADELAAQLRDSGPAIVCGEVTDEQVDELAAIDHVTVPPLPIRMRQPAALAEIGWKRWCAGIVADAATLEPIYLSRQS